MTNNQHKDINDEHDFKAALEDFTDCLMEFGDNGMTRKNTNAVITALRLADGLKSGEVSEGMSGVGLKVVNDYLDNMTMAKVYDTSDIYLQALGFKAMAAQMIDELED